MAFYCVAHSDAIIELALGVFALDLLELGRSVLVKELVDAQVAATNANVDLVLVNFYNDSLSAELVDALGLTHEQDLQLLAIWVVVDVLCNLFVNSVILDGDIDRNPRLQVNDVGFQVVDFIVQ